MHQSVDHVIDAELGELFQNQRDVLLGARVVVIPRRAPEPARHPAIRSPPQPRERETAVVGDVGAMAPARQIELGKRPRDREQEQDHGPPRNGEMEEWGNGGMGEWKNVRTWNVHYI